MTIYDLINKIPLFNDKENKIIDNIYHNDRYQSCFLVISDKCYYKLRIPSKFNPKSVENEFRAITFLTQKKISNIPIVVEHGIILNSNINYLVQSYHSGNSIDKIYTSLTEHDWECIINQLKNYLLSLHNLHEYKFKTFNSDHTTFENYGTMLSSGILKHLEKNVNAGLITIDISNHIKKQLNGIENIFLQQPTFLHFDIKPQNIIYDTEQQVVTVIDYEYSRFGEISHELFRGSIAAKRNPYFFDAWSSIYKDIVEEHDNFSDQKTYYFKLFFILSELSYANFTKDNELISSYLKSLHDQLC